MSNETEIKEIFTSIQGEGNLVGYKQLFIRFCKCNLDCKYCDTDFISGEKYSSEKIIEICNSVKDCHSIVITGGEPLLDTDFLLEILPQVELPVYLETNATLSEEFSKIKNYVTYVSADIKLPSCTGMKPMWNEHDVFFEISKGKNLFAKIVFDENIQEFEIMECVKLAGKYDIELILQPKMNGKELTVSSSFMLKTLDKFLQKHKKTRLIPQVHKFINVI